MPVRPEARDRGGRDAGENLADAEQPASAPRLVHVGARAPRGEPLAACVERALEDYFDDLDGEPTTDLYAMVLDEIEAPLLATVMRRVAGNQSRAAEMLGLSRGTLRKKLRHHGLL